MKSKDRDIKKTNNSNPGDIKTIEISWNQEIKSAVVLVELCALKFSSMIESGADENVISENTVDFLGYHDTFLPITIPSKGYYSILSTGALCTQVENSNLPYTGNCIRTIHFTKFNSPYYSFSGQKKKAGAACLGALS